MYRNIAGQRLPIFAYDITTGNPVAGDAANITATISRDGGAPVPTSDANPTELDAAQAPGIYYFEMTQEETNAGVIVLYATSPTPNVEIEPWIIFTELYPTGRVQRVSF